MILITVYTVISPLAAEKSTRSAEARSARSGLAAFPYRTNFLYTLFKMPATVATEKNSMQDGDSLQ